jgi:hypothetical protein
MSTPVFMKLRDWLVDAGLTADYKIQLAQWVEQKADTGTMKYIVFQPDGGTGRIQDIGADDNVQVILVSGKNDPQPVILRAQEILNFVTENPDDSCLNSIFNLGGLPAPIPTEEGRTVIRLLFRCTS